MNLDEIIKSARAEKEADILLTNARIVDVFSGEIVDSNIAIAGGYIVGFGSYPAKRTVDMENRFVSPGFIDAHVHIESSMTCITEFARAIIPFGTTTVFADPHEIANVLGVDGINYMLESSKNQPMNIYFTLSSCVPATDMETSGARLDADDLSPFMGNDRIAALAEMMNYPGVIHNDPEVLRKIELAKAHGKPVDGHAPGLTGKDLYAYIAAGISSDHECTTAKEAKEKLNAGMHIMIREGTAAKNLLSLIPIVNEKSSSRIMWCTDDRHPHDILEEGHIDSMVRRAIHAGIDPVIAIQMATINPANYFGISDIGAIGPGRRADLVVFSDLHSPCIEEVYCGGILVAQEEKMSLEIKKPEPVAFQPSMNVGNIGNKEIDFSIPAQAKFLRVIDIVPDQVITNQSVVEVAVSDNKVVSDITRDILKIAVVERHTGSGNIGKGFVRGFGLKKGALSSSVAHDSHNIIVVGTNDEDMKAAVEALIKMGGGLAASCDSKICATLPLPVAGLMSQEPVYAVKEKLDKLLEVAQDFGTTLNDPFMTLSFLALPVIPELKITDKGLVDVKQFCIVPLFAD
ncbi:MAG: adenine deaminase [Desulfobacteraceae bacterium Eth-SRB1]|nr:MAG: adenine deaminase [Desulfobacteraceae bacterium Eth-SRB1]